MKYSVIAGLLCLVTCSSRAQTQPPTQSETNIVAKPIDTSMYFVFKFDKNRDHIFFNGDFTSTDLSYDEIRQIEKAIRKRSATSSKNERIYHSGRYYKQFLPVLNSKGEKEVWVSCFCMASQKSYWKDFMILTDGGGRCFFILVLI